MIAHAALRIGLRIILWAAAVLSGAVGQAQLKPLDPNNARISYSFSLRAGMKPFRFQVQLDKNSTITGVAVFSQADSIPFETLPACEDKGLTMELNEYDKDRELLKHADLNFDGFDDVQLLQFYHPHLGKSIYCIYTWDERNARFRYAPEIPAIDPIAHPRNRTITVHEEWFGGVYTNSTYRWKAAKLELICESGRLTAMRNPRCGFTDFCSMLIHGKMVITAEKASGCDNKDDIPLICPAPKHAATKRSQTVN